MGVVMKIVHKTGIVTEASADVKVGDYVQAYDPEFRDGRGMVETTPDLDKAKVWATLAEAMEAWHAVPKCRPLRADGEPNRPLTALTVEILPFPEKGEQ